MWATTATGAGGSVGVMRARSEVLPAGFTDSVIATLDRPIALAATNTNLLVHEPSVAFTLIGFSSTRFTITAQ